MGREGMKLYCFPPQSSIYLMLQDEPGLDERLL